MCRTLQGMSDGENPLLYFIKANHRIDLATKHARILRKWERDLAGPSGPTVSAWVQGLERKEADFKLWAESINKRLASVSDERSRCNQVLDEMRGYQSVGGKIRVDRYTDLLNVARHLHDDKKGPYRLVPGYNRRILPDILASALAIMLKDRRVTKDVRPLLEQHLMAIMNNYDYVACVHDQQLYEILNETECKRMTYYAVMGAAPPIFNKTEYCRLMIERVERANRFVNTHANQIRKRKKLPIHIWKNVNHVDLNRRLTQSDGWELNRSLEEAGSESPGATTKVTESALGKFLPELKATIEAEQERHSRPVPYNLVLFSSTFHIARLAVEVERWFFQNVAVRPHNTIIVGTQNFFWNLREASKTNAPENVPFALKKVKSCLFDLMMHATDKNHD